MLYVSRGHDADENVRCWNELSLNIKPVCRESLFVNFLTILTEVLLTVDAVVQVNFSQLFN